MREITVTDEETTLIDVSALFIAPDEAITSIRQRLEKDNILGERTSIASEHRCEVVELVGICLKTTYLCFNGNSTSKFTAVLWVLLFLLLLPICAWRILKKERLDITVACDRG